MTFPRVLHSEWIKPRSLRSTKMTLALAVALIGRTVFVFSHLMSEMALTAEHLIVIGRGELIADTSVAQFSRRASANTVRVRSPQAALLRDLIAGPKVSVSSEEAKVLTVSDSPRAHPAQARAARPGAGCRIRLRDQAHPPVLTVPGPGGWGKLVWSPRVGRLTWGVPVRSTGDVAHGIAVKGPVEVALLIAARYQIFT